MDVRRAHLHAAAPTPSPALARYHPSRCAAPTCDYAYAASAPTLQLPLLLSATDLDSLLHAGVPREVGCAHLGSTYYGSTYYGSTYCG